MSDQTTNLHRRRFLSKTGALAAGSFFIHPIAKALNLRENPAQKLRVALVGTGIRGTSMFGRSIVEDYPNEVEFVGLSDINEGRLAYGKTYIGVDCPTFVDFDEMMATVKPDVLIVTTMDSTHDQFIIKASKPAPMSSPKSP